MMNEMKTYIIRLIIVTATVELGAIITGEKYRKIYSLVGAVFIIFALLSLPKTDISGVAFQNHKTIEFEADGIAKRFTDGVAQRIKYDILNVFDTEVSVFVTTDNSYSKICITIKCECSDEIKFKIEEYVSKNYCSSDDEVIMVGE